jgi:hypothetical protein
MSDEKPKRGRPKAPPSPPRDYGSDLEFQEIIIAHNRAQIIRDHEDRQLAEAMGIDWRPPIFTSRTTWWLPKHQDGTMRVEIYDFYTPQRRARKP